MADDAPKKGSTVKYSQNLAKNLGFKRAFGKAKLFEIRRLVRRIRQFENKKGTNDQLKKNQRKVLRMEQQLDIAKEARVEMLIAHMQEKSGAVETQTNTNEQDAKEVVLEKLLKAIDVDKFAFSTTDRKNKGPRSNSESSRDKHNHSRRRNTDSNQNNVVSKKRKNSESFASDSAKDHLSGPTELNAKQGMVPSKRSKVSDENMVVKSVEPRSLKETENATARKNAKKVKNKLEIEDDIIPRSLESMFVGNLKDIGNSQKKKSMKKSQKDLKKNRMGQNARQKMWENLYGKKAKHCLKATKEEKTAKKEQFKATKKKHQKEACEKVLHPSWEASKSKRKKETLVEFTGQKITFDD